MSAESHEKKKIKEKKKVNEKSIDLGLDWSFWSNFYRSHYYMRVMNLSRKGVFWHQGQSLTCYKIVIHIPDVLGGHEMNPLVCVC